ncbi:unnamed protein product [Musa acuminata subsp. malaccensis]|uniref:(wild Malaysian banana) hypothetical protein n=1 Tax=Musa acuminata subsp. malaccensis TaxID=214687 RepID=A0A804K486_MUSAM|nr:unnamed protein product [Musa acuminata subsp. malaccensis]
MLKHNTSAEKIFVKIKHSTNLSVRVNDRFATCISNCEKEDCVKGTIYNFLGELPDQKKKETLKLYVSGSGWCIIEHIGCVKAVKPYGLYSSASWFEFTQLL